MQSARDSSTFFALPKAARLRWMVYLRWMALSAVAVGLGVSQVAGLSWVAPRPIAVALVGGLLYNLAFLWRVRRLEEEPIDALSPSDTGGGGALVGGSAASPTSLTGSSSRLTGSSSSLTNASARVAASVDRELELQALSDVGALTLLLAASGGLQNPICMFYGFHVVLGAMLGDRRGALIAAVAAGGGIAALALAQRGGHLLSLPLSSPPLWLTAGTALLTVACLAYFSLSVLRFVEREQGRAVRNHELLLIALDRLQVGLELVAPDGRLLLANRRAALLHPVPTMTGRWQPPAGLPTGVPKHTGDSARFAFTEGEGGETRIIEMLVLSGEAQAGGGGGGVRAYLYADRTEATVDEQRAIMLERLASLGRVMQEVAHELNTPLASIQTLAVDLSHSLSQARGASMLGADEAESVALIVDEARRCQQISRELLSTARLGLGSPVRTLLADVVRRATRLTYGRRHGLVSLLGDLDLTCITDGDRLLQILVNLLQNASDASDRSVEVTLSRRAAHEGTLGRACAEIVVRDHGPGLPPQVAERLFVPFISTKPPGQGTGLGLYTCARLAGQLGGTLMLTNGDGGMGPGGGKADAAQAAGGGVVARLCLPLDSSDVGGESNQSGERSPAPVATVVPHPQADSGRCG